MLCDLGQDPLTCVLFFTFLQKLLNKEQQFRLLIFVKEAENNTKLLMEMLQYRYYMYVWHSALYICRVRTVMIF